MRFLRLRILTLACLVGLLGVAPAEAIIDGQDDGGEHPYVVFVGDLRPDPVTGLRPFCSGALIDSTTVVTAAHCFPPFAPGAPPVVLVSNAEDGPFAGPPSWGLYMPNPDFCAECPGGDVAVVKIVQGPILLSQYAQLPAVGQSQTLKNNSPVTIVGYGVQGFMHGGGPPQPFADLSRTKATAGLGNAGKELADEFLKVKLNHGGFCMGDSGGPVLLGDTILAVNSFVNNALCKGVGYSYRLDTGAAQSFIAAMR